MDSKITSRVKQEAIYLIKTNETIRNIAVHFKISKSTVHKDLQERLRKVSPNMNKEVQKILELHQKEKHMKGGIATKEKYKKE